MKRDLLVAGLLSFCLAAMLFMIMPIESKVGYYDPWIDLNDDGKIDMKDVAMAARAYGSLGQPISKASLSYDSGWVNIIDKAGQYFNMTHSLNSTDVIADIIGMAILGEGIHQRYLGLTGHLSGWWTTFRGTNVDRAHSIVQTIDGGYATAGYTNSFGAGSTDFWLIKFDVSGYVQWNKTYGGVKGETAYSLVQTSDGGYALAGETFSFGLGDDDVYLVKTDSQGNLVWDKTYGGVKGETVHSLVQTSDGGYALVGTTYSFGPSWDAYLVKTDSDGNLVWNKTYGGAWSEFVSSSSIVQTIDGGYALAGETNSFGPSRDAYLVKTDSDGNLVWEKTYGGASDEYIYSLVQTSDGGYAMAGHSWSFGPSIDLYLVKTDSDGNMEWNQTYGGTDNDYCYSMVQTIDGGYALAGGSWSFGTSNNVYLVKTDSQGNLVWEKTYGGASPDYAKSLVQTSDGGYAMVGTTYSFGSGDVFLVKTDVELGLAWTGSTPNTIILYRGATDAYWNYVRVRVWKIKENP